MLSVFRKPVSGIVIILILLIPVLYVFIGALKVDNQDKIPPIRTDYKVLNIYSLEKTLTSVSKEDLAERSPYGEYLRHSNPFHIRILQKDLQLLDSLYRGEKMHVRMILSNALTDSLKQVIGPGFNQYQPDSLIRLMQWVQPFRYYAAALAPEDSLLYVSVHDYWMDFVSNRMAEYTRKESGLKFDFKFRFLQAKCSENNVSVPVKVSYIEKVIYNIIINDWVHLFQASWNQASVLQIIFAILFLGITILSYALFFIKILNRFFRKK